MDRKYYNFTLMPLLQARYSKINKTYRCGMVDCGKVIAKGDSTKDNVTIRCSCGIDNNISVAPQNKSEGRREIVGKTMGGK